MHLIWLVLSLWCFAQSCIDAFSAEGSSEKPMMVVVELQRQQCQHRPDLTATFSESLAWPVNFDARLQLLPPAMSLMLHVRRSLYEDNLVLDKYFIP